MARSFRNLMANIGELGQVPSRVATAAAGDINKLLEDEFNGEHDPYGKDWAPLRPATIKKKGHDRIMVETGKTMNETRAYPMGGKGIEIRSTEAAGLNQFKRANAPARPVLPAEADLPDAWEEAIEKRTEEAFAKVMAK